MDIPKYELVKNYIRHLLMDGTVSYGEKLPSEYDLIAKFNVSRHTIRKAFAELSNTGYVFKKQGMGTFRQLQAQRKPETGRRRFVYIYLVFCIPKHHCWH